ncbi:hypothetical protein RchiOBHm_Chr2g0167711 [Rosa chinensis]|uniref:Disease resistance protein At4g27190-like leucine-rich repeats domain-containing protein n=1 Tax=Rosa chinensis TaxID=74649 RepID=A0A2P6S4D2_ROSCH|nr:hypothetical protein RchiOBHm_Chr2g0167711 [Rosa chinensis]
MEDIIVDIDWAGGRACNNPRNSMMRIQSCFFGLQYIMVNACADLKDLSQLCFVPNLQFVLVLRCSRMETIINLSKLGGDANVAKEFNLFAKLKRLDLAFLPALESVYKTALPLPCLKQH